MLRHRPLAISKIVTGLATLAVAGSLSAAPVLLLGETSGGPVQQYSLSGTFIADFGPSGGAAATVDGLGNVFVVQPGATQSTITQYDENQNAHGSGTFTGGVDNGNGFPGFINDMAWSGMGLWLAGYNGMIYHTTTAGAVLSSFDSGNTFAGVATDGTFLYTSQGFGGGGITKRDLNGAVVGTITTGLPETFGLAFDSGTGTLYVGGSGIITHIDSNGTVLDTLSVPGVHTGLAVADLSSTSVPEPTALSLVVIGLTGFFVYRRNRLRV